MSRRCLLIAAAVTATSCTRGEPAERDKQPAGERATPAAKKAAATRPAVRDGRAAASCPPLPDPVAIRPAPAARRWPLRLADRVTGGNKTRSYPIMRTAAGPTGARWIGASYDGGVLWDGSKRVRELPCGDCTVHDAAVADDDKTLLIGLNRIDLASAALTRPTGGGDPLAATNTNEVTAVAWPPDGAIALVATHFRPLACCRDRDEPRARPQPNDRAIVIDGTSGALVRDLAAIPGFSHSVAASRAQLVAMTSDGLTAWDRATFTATRREAPASGNLLVFDRTGGWLASTEVGTITLWRMPDFCPVARIAAGEKFVHALAFHPSAPVLFAATEHTVHAYSIDPAGEELGAVDVPAGSPAVAQSINSLAVTADGRRLAVPVYMGQDVLLFDVTPP